MSKKRAEKVTCPIHRLKKKEILWLYEHHCKHGHRYLEHYNCYLQEHPEVIEKVGFLDIECSNLDANWGVMLSYCIKVKGGEGILKGVIDKKDIQIKDMHQQLDEAKEKITRAEIAAGDLKVEIATQKETLSEQARMLEKMEEYKAEISSLQSKVIELNNRLLKLHE